jgi:hypothetical protein
MRILFLSNRYPVVLGGYELQWYVLHKSLNQVVEKRDRVLAGKT